MMTLLTPDVPDINKTEVLRYMGVRKTDAAVEELVADCINESRSIFDHRLCYDIFALSVSGENIDFGFTSVESRSLATDLAGCEKAVVSVATVGLGIDRLIHRYARISPSRAVCMQAIGAERIEALCDSFENLLKERYRIRPRFSPGYGDLTLSMQKEIFAFFDCPKSLGVTLTESLLMSPSKSVTAITGITEEL